MLKGLKGTIFCLLKSGPDVIQIQSHLNRDDFDVSRITTHNIKKNRNGKQRKNAILNKKKKQVVCT